MCVVCSPNCHFIGMLGHHDGIWVALLCNGASRKPTRLCSSNCKLYPAYAVVLYFFYICAYGAKWFHTRSVQRCLLGVEMVAGLIDFAGGILFLAACATLDLNDPYVLAYGVCAGVFGIIAGVTNILSRSCCCAYNCCVMDDQTPTNVEEDHSMDCEGFKGLLLHLYNCFGFCQGRSDLKEQVLV